jgi:isocitrate dehydrogenase (NAD+)
LIVDNTAMQMVMRPEQFDLLLMPNLYGDIISDLAAGLWGAWASCRAPTSGTSTRCLKAVHGSAPDIAGKGIANPTAIMMSGAMMLDHLGEIDAAARLRNAVERVYQEGHHLTGDVGGTAIDRRVHRCGGTEPRVRRLVCRESLSEYRSRALRFRIAPSRSGWRSSDPRG